MVLEGLKFEYIDIFRLIKYIMILYYYMLHLFEKYI